MPPYEDDSNNFLPEDEERLRAEEFGISDVWKQGTPDYYDEIPLPYVIDDDDPASETPSASASVPTSVPVPQAYSPEPQETSPVFPNASVTPLVKNETRTVDEVSREEQPIKAEDVSSTEAIASVPPQNENTNIPVFSTEPNNMATVESVETKIVEEPAPKGFKEIEPLETKETIPSETTQEDSLDLTDEEEPSEETSIFDGTPDNSALLKKAFDAAINAGSSNELDTAVTSYLKGIGVTSYSFIRIVARYVVFLAKQGMASVDELYNEVTKAGEEYLSEQNGADSISKASQEQSVQTQEQPNVPSKESPAIQKTEKNSTPEISQEEQISKLEKAEAQAFEIANQTKVLSENERISELDTFAKNVSEIGLTGVSAKDSMVSFVKGAPVTASYMKQNFSNALSAVKLNGEAINHLSLGKIGTVLGKSVPLVAEQMKKMVVSAAVLQNPGIAATLGGATAIYLTGKALKFALVNNPSCINNSEIEPTTFQLHYATKKLISEGKTDDMKELFKGASNSHPDKLNAYICRKAVDTDYSCLEFVPESIAKDFPLSKQTVYDVAHNCPHLLTTTPVVNYLQKHQKEMLNIVKNEPNALLHMPYAGKPVVATALFNDKDNYLVNVAKNDYSQNNPVISRILSVVKEVNGSIENTRNAQNLNMGI